MAVLEEQQRRIKEAMASKPAPPPEDIEMKVAMKAMGAMEEGDAIFGSNSEVNLDSQVLQITHAPNYLLFFFFVVLVLVLVFG